MENLRTCEPKRQGLKLPLERFDGNNKVDDFKEKRRALSRRTSDLANVPPRPRRIAFEDDPVDYTTPREPKILSIEDKKRNAKLMATSQRLAKMKILTDIRKNQLDLDTYAQMVKREPLPYRNANLLNKPKGPRRSPLQDVSTDYSRPRGLNIPAIAESGNRTNVSTGRSTNRLDLDKYAQMVVNNDKQCPNRIRKLARPKRYFEIGNPWWQLQNDIDDLSY